MSLTPVNLKWNHTDLDAVLHIKNLNKVLSSKIPNYAYCNLNLCINGLRQHHNHHLKGYDLYVLGFWFEVFDDTWFYKTYTDNPHAEFLILTDLEARDLNSLPRVTVINLLHWQYFSSKFQPFTINWDAKIYKISSLSRRITQFRYYVTAALIGNADVFYRWNLANVVGNQSSHIYEPTGWPKRDALLKQRALELSKPINSESFNNDPVESIQSTGTNPAYSFSLVNSINENKDICYTKEIGYGPGPYMTEKTWKPLMAGCALLFAGPYGIESRLEQAGFAFNYPWSNDYDQCARDLERLEQIIATIDIILGMSHSDIISGIRESVEYNQSLFATDDFNIYVQHVNQKGIDEILEYFS